MNDELHADLRAIQRADPDGGEREPTTADYEAFQRWAIETFGRSAWKIYSTGGWAE